MSIKKTAAIVASIILMVAGQAVCEESNAADESAVTVSNEAIAELAAWENTEARKILQKNRGKYGKTPEFKTAWALLEIQEGAGGDASKATKALTSLGQSTKKQNAGAATS